MKFLLESAWGDQDTLYVRDLGDPELTDELGRPVLDLSTLGRIYPQARAPDTPGFVFVLDTFIARPTSGLSDFWLDYPEDNMAFRNMSRDYAIALEILTGKRLVAVSK